MSPEPSSLYDDVAEVLISEEAIQRRIAELGQRITEDFAGSEVLMIAVLKGALLFLADLVRHVDLPVAM
ncbi:MAG: hypoxanthine phosphoribosyltransferase, partial [Anaerolineae bacterium]|nr:hypoxanthine phosphoribosyltransferase [Anaerolineae bacterium]